MLTAKKSLCAKNLYAEIYSQGTDSFDPFPGLILRHSYDNTYDRTFLLNILFCKNQMIIKSQAGDLLDSSVEGNRFLGKESKWATVFSAGEFSPAGDIWQCLETLRAATLEEGEEVLLTPTGQRPGLLTDIAQCSGQPSRERITQPQI